MECEENLPDYSGHADLVEYIDPIGVFSRADDYYRIAREVVTYYQITLCDELDASIVGWFANWLTVRPRIMERDVADLEAPNHATFLRVYVRVNNIPITSIAEPHKFLIDSSLTTSADVQEVSYGVLWLRADKESIVAEIRRLAQIYSRPTINEIDVQLSQTGGVIIRGQEDASWACDTAEATAFRNRARRKVSGHWSVRAPNPSRITSRKRRNAAAYQIQKCGDREYSVLPGANSRLHAPLADGLAPTVPPRGRTPHVYPCCILDAKYSTGTFGLYQRRRDYVRKVNAASRSSVFVPPWLRRTGARGAIVGFDGVRATEVAQLGGYIGACVDRDIPYWRILYICNTARTASYFSREVVGRTPGARAFAGVVISRKSRGSRSNQNWIV